MKTLAQEQYPFPLSSPEAAAVLTRHEDDLAPGLQRAAEEAVELDPHSVEALVMLGDLADSIEHRVEQYRRASAAAAQKDPAARGEHMPQLRLHMGSQLISDARIADAAEILLPALQEDPDDVVGARWPLTAVMLRLGWDDDLREILRPLDDEEVGTTPWAMALLRYRQTGPTQEADQLLERADDLNQYVYPMLAGLESPPEESYGTFWVGSEDEAGIIARYLLPAWRETPGAVKWIRDTLEDLDHDFEEDEFDDDQDPLDAAIELPAGRQRWRMRTVKDRESRKVVAVILDDKDDLIHVDSFDQQPSAWQLRNFVLDAIAEPIKGPPRKPAELLVPTKALLGRLYKICATIDVACAQQQPTEEEKSHLAQLVKMLAASDRESSPTTDIGELPQHEETWLYGLFHPPIWIADRATPRRTWLQIAVDATAGKILGNDIAEEKPSPVEMASFLQKTMGTPAIGSPRRPQQCLLDPDDAAALDPDALNAAGIAVGKLEDREIFTDLISSLVEHNGPTDQRLLDADGVDTASLERLYEVCSRFYRAAPWRMVPGDQFIQMSCAGWQNQIWTACVIGQMGQELGIALYEDPEYVQQIVKSDQLDAESMRCVVAHFDEAFNAIPVDVWNIERHGWAIANSEAYPFIARINPGSEVVCPSAEDLQVLETAMTHLPRFLNLPRNETMTVESPHPDQPQTMTVQWVHEPER